MNILSPYTLTVLHLLTERSYLKSELYCSISQRKVLDELIAHDCIRVEAKVCRLAPAGAMLYKELKAISERFGDTGYIEGAEYLKGHSQLTRVGAVRGRYSKSEE